MFIRVHVLLWTWFLSLLAMPRRFVTQQEAALMFSVTDRTIRSWISRGLITGFRLPTGRAIRVDANEIAAMLKAVPTARPSARPVFGPHARIVNVAETVEGLKRAEGGDDR